MKLVDVYSTDVALDVLYRLLNERPIEANISHSKMPTWEEHVEYVNKRPVPYWYLIMVIGCSSAVGSIYLSRRREIGVSIFKFAQRRGYASAAVRELMQLHPGEFYANVAPANMPSHALFTGMGAKLVQMTYRFGG